MSGFLRTQLKQLLVDTLPKQYRNDNTAKQRKFLIDCIEQQGYIALKKQVMSESESDQEIDPEDYLDSDDYSRTFIHDDEKLTKLQQRGITSDESEFNKIKNIIDTTLNAISRDNESLNVDSVKKTAMSMYKKIMGYYKNPKYPEIKSNSKGIKRGYIALVIYYALNNVISKERLVEYFQDPILPSDLFNADKYLHLIIPNLPTTNPYLSNLCGFRDKLDKNVVNQINEVIEGLPEKNTKNIAAAIYYVCKGKITLKALGESCGVSSSTISKAVKEI